MATSPRSASTAPARGHSTGSCPSCCRAAALPLRLRAAIDRETRQPLPGAGSGAASDQEVLENGLKFGVDLLHGQKGGLFLDQRENRAEVGRRSADKTVLNLFGYTGGFSVYAAAGGARRTDTVDLGPAGHRGGARQLPA